MFRASGVRDAHDPYKGTADRHRVERKREADKRLEDDRQKLKEVRRGLIYACSYLPASLVGNCCLQRKRARKGGVLMPWSIEVALQGSAMRILHLSDAEGSVNGINSAT